MRAHSPSPFTLALNESQRTATLRVDDTAAAAAAAAPAAAAAARDNQWEWEARRHASRTLASYSARRHRDPLRSLQPPPLSFTERSLPGEHRSPDAVPRRIRPSPFSAEAHKKAIRGLQHRAVPRPVDRFAAPVAAAAAAASSYPASAPRRRERFVWDEEPSMAAFVPVGELTSPNRGHLTGSRTPVFTSPVRRAPSQRAPSLSPSLLAASSSFAHLSAGHAIAAPATPTALLSRSHPASPNGYHMVAHAAAASLASPAQSQPSAPLGSPKVSWSLEQWKAWAETPNPATALEASRRGPLSVAQAAALAADTTPVHPSDQLLYPASLLLSPPRVREAAAMKAEAGAAETAQAPLADAGSNQHLASFATDLVVPALLGNAGPVQLPASFQPIDAASSPFAAASSPVRSTTSLVACSIPLLASPPPSTVHSIAVQALRNLHARLLLSRTYDAWRMLYRHRAKLHRMLLFVGDQFDRNMLSFHFQSWLRHLSARVEQRAEEQRCRVADAHFRRRRARLAMQRWGQLGRAAQLQEERVDLIWRQRGHDLHSLHLRRCALKQWFVLTRHYYRLQERCEAHHRRRVARSVFFPWLHGANVSQVASLFERRVLLRRQWGGWRAVFLRKATARGLEHALAARKRGRLFYAWHQQLEHNFLLKQYHYNQWRRLFHLNVAVRKWRHERALHAWRSVVRSRQDAVARADAHAALLAPAVARRCAQAAWDEWKRQAEVRFEHNFLLVVDGWRRSKLRRLALARWGALVARRRRAFLHAGQVVRFQERRAQAEAVAQWRKKQSQREADRVRMGRAAAHHLQSRRRAFLRRWRIFNSDKQLLASRTALVQLVHSRPFLRTLRLHAEYQAYKRRMREAGTAYSVRRMGGVLFDQWRGRAEGYRVGREQQLPPAYWREPKGFEGAGGATEAERDQAKYEAAAAALRECAPPPSRAAAAPTTVAMSLSASLGRVAPSRPTLLEHPFAKFVQSAKAPSTAATATSSATFAHTSRAQALSFHESPTRQRAAPLSPSALAPSAQQQPKLSWSQLYPRSSHTSSVLTPPHKRKKAARAEASAAAVAATAAGTGAESTTTSVLHSPRDFSVAFAPFSASASASNTAGATLRHSSPLRNAGAPSAASPASGPGSGPGQLYPLDHATSVSAFPRSEFLSLPLKSSSAILLQAVQGLPEHGLPRPAGEVVPKAWAASEARRELLLPREQHVPVRFGVPIPPVDFQPVLLPAASAGAGTGTNKPFASPRSGRTVPVLSSTSMSTSTSMGATGPLHLSALSSSPTRVSAVASPSSPARPSAGGSVGPYPSFYTEASRGSVSAATESVDPAEVRKSNRQKLERMLRVSAMPAGLFYSQKQQQDQAQAQSQSQRRSQPRQQQDQSSALHATRARASGPLDPTEVDDATWECDEANYRHEELSRLHYKLSLKRRVLEAWAAQRGAGERVAPLEERVARNTTMRFFEAWVRAHTNLLKLRLIRARSAWHLGLHNLRLWALRAREREEHRADSESLLAEFLQRRLAERVFRAWQIGHWSAVAERKLHEQALAERKVALLGLLADFVPGQNSRTGLRFLREWHRAALLARGQRLREQRLLAKSDDFLRGTLGPHLFRPILLHWRARLAQRQRLKAELRRTLVDAAFTRTTRYRTHHFLRVLSPVLERIQIREALRAALKEKWRDQVRFHKARQVMARVSRAFQARDAMWLWGWNVRAMAERERWEGALASLQGRVRNRVVRPLFQGWSGLSAKLARIRLHRTLLAEAQHDLLSRRVGALFYGWHASARRQAKEREAKQKAAAKAARKAQLFLSMQVAHLCNKLALLRRSFRRWTLEQRRRVEQRQRAAEVLVPVVPVFLDAQGALLHTEVRSASSPGGRAGETALPFGVLYQPFAIASPVPPPPPPQPPRSPLALMPSQLGVDPRSPTSLRNLVAPPERTPEEKQRLAMEKSFSAASAASPSASVGPRPAQSSVSIEDERAPPSPRPAGLHLSDLAFFSPAKPSKEAGPARSAGQHAAPFQHAATASAYPGPAAASTFDQAEMLWHTAPQAPLPQAHGYQQQHEYAATSAAPLADFRGPASSMAPAFPPPQEEQHPSAGASVSASFAGDSSLRIHRAPPSPYSPLPPSHPTRSPERLHVSFAPSSFDSAADDENAAGPSEADQAEPQFVGFALPFPDGAAVAVEHDDRRSRRVHGSPQTGALGSPTGRLRLVRTPVRDARDLFVPLRSVLSSPEDASPEPRRIPPRSRFASAAAETRDRARVLDPRRAAAAANAGASAGSEGARSLSSKRFELLNSGRNSYAAIHDSQQQLLVAAAQRSRMTSSGRGSAKGPAKDGARTSKSGAASTTRSAPPADSLLHQAFVQQQEAAAAERAAAAQQRALAMARPDARHGRFGPFRK